jgi:hypothetical protein
MSERENNKPNLLRNQSEPFFFFMNSQEKRRFVRRLITTITPIVCVFYLHFIYIRVDNITEFKYELPFFSLFALGCGLIVSVLPIRQRLRFSMLSTGVVPLLIYLLELLIFSVASQKALAKGREKKRIKEATNIDADPVLYNFFYIVVVGAFVFAILSIIGTFIGIKFQDFLQQKFEKSMAKKIQNEDDLLFASSRKALFVTMYIGIAISTISLVMQIIN